MPAGIQPDFTVDVAYCMNQWRCCLDCAVDELELNYDVQNHRVFALICSHLIFSYWPQVWWDGTLSYKLYNLTFKHDDIDSNWGIIITDTRFKATYEISKTSWVSTVSKSAKYQKLALNSWLKSCWLILRQGICRSLKVFFQKNTLKVLKGLKSCLLAAVGSDVLNLLYMEVMKKCDPIINNSRPYHPCWFSIIHFDSMFVKLIANYILCGLKKVLKSHI